MAIRKANAAWEGKLQDGKGKMKLGSGAYIGSYSFESRFEDGIGTNPEELIGAAHAGCFSMALTKLLQDSGYNPSKVETDARVQLEKGDDGFRITSVQLSTQGDVENMEADEFHKLAEKAKQNCPVSKALAGVDIKLESKLLTSAS